MCDLTEARVREIVREEVEKMPFITTPTAVGAEEWEDLPDGEYRWKTPAGTYTPAAAHDEGWRLQRKVTHDR